MVSPEPRAGFARKAADAVRTRAPRQGGPHLSPSPEVPCFRGLVQGPPSRPSFPPLKPAARSPWIPHRLECSLSCPPLILIKA